MSTTAEKDASIGAPLKASDRLGFPNLAKLLFVFLQLCLLTLILFPFCWFPQNWAFNHVVILAFSGFLVHHLLPLRWRLPFFVLLSVAAVIVVFGTFPGVWLLLIGLALIGLCHLPIRFAARVALVIMAGAALAVFRLESPDWQDMTAIWPILGSMFMFRLIIYLYDLRHQAAPFHPSWSLAYFFMLPNACFPMFPVVDYKTFHRSHYNDDDFRIYQTGIRWIIRGIMQLIFYRLVYQHLLNDPAEIDSIGGLFRYMVSTFLLFLRISGDYHLIVGMLHLFGFNLPETQHRWLLSSSFLDFWRRINIYWRDFMVKIVFYPLFFRLRGTGNLRAMLCASAGVFVATWFLHSYQWFWIRGSFPMDPQDTVYWTILGVLIIVNIWWENRSGRQRVLTERKGSWRSALGLAARTMGTFLVIIFTWSIWAAESFDHWISLFSSATTASTNDLLLIAAVLGAIGIGAILFGTSKREWSGKFTGAGAVPRRAFKFWRSAASTCAICLGLIILSLAEVHWLFGPQTAQVFKSLKTNRLNQQDARVLERGYYEELTNPLRISPELWEVFQKEPPGWRGENLIRESPENPFLRDLIPLMKTVSKGVAFSTNRWGMRDRDYEQKKPPNTYRIGLLGASRSMGWGVEDNRTYENLLEDRLNREYSEGQHIRYEILNFAVGGSSPIQKLATLEKKALNFDLDAVLYATSNEDRWVVRDMAKYMSLGFDIPYPDLIRIAKRADVEPGFQLQVLAARRLNPHAEEMVRSVYKLFSEKCRQHGVRAFILFLPTEGGLPPAAKAEVARTMELARNEGLIPLDLQDAYRGIQNQQQSLLLAEWDLHPNEQAHQLIADELYRQLQPHLSTSTTSSIPGVE